MKTILQIRVDQTEKAVWIEEAQRANMTLTQLVLNRLRQAPSGPDERTKHELAKILCEIPLTVKELEVEHPLREKLVRMEELVWPFLK